MKFTREEYLERGANFPKEDGYVCLGGGVSDDLKDFHPDEIYSRATNKQPLSSGWTGGSVGHPYYVKEETFNKKFPMKRRYKYQIKIHGPEHGKLVQETLFARGFVWNGDGSQELKQAFKQAFQQGRVGEIVISHEDTLLYGSFESEFGGDAETITLDDVFKLDLRKKITSVLVKLNCDYNAVVTKETIKVGCQEFPISIIKDLAEAYEKLG